MAPREGSLEAPTRHPLDWKSKSFYDKENLLEEMERIFDLCHGCRRCVSLCNSFPTLFDLVDESATMEVDGVKKEDYWKVVDHCYLCEKWYRLMFDNLLQHGECADLRRFITKTLQDVSLCCRK